VNVTFFVRSAPFPVGGHTALYEYANGLSRRGHRVCIVHGRWEHSDTATITDLDELSWFTFEPGVEHEIARERTPARLPDADVIVGYARGGPAAGAPVGVVQGYKMLPAAIEDRTFRAPRPKICVARWLVDVGTSKGVPARQLVHVPLGIHHDTYRVLTPIESRPSQVAMLYNPHHQKGPELGLAALAEVQRRVPGVTVRVFGSGVPAHPMPPGVTYERLPARDVIVGEIYNASRVFVCSSLVEGFGLSSVEAMACGCALATTDNGGSEDYAFHGRTALCSEPGDLSALVESVATLLTDDERRTAIARRGVEQARSFQWDESARLLEAFFESYRADPAAYVG
jgi:hypothetical protein